MVDSVNNPIHYLRPDQEQVRKMLHQACVAWSRIYGVMDLYTELLLHLSQAFLLVYI
jgi:hypothetical protein